MILSVGWSLLVFLVCLFLPAGTWAWTRGWLFLLVLVGAPVVMTVYLRRVNPDVIAGRINRHDGANDGISSWERSSSCRPCWRSRLSQPWTMADSTGSTYRGGAV